MCACKYFITFMIKFSWVKHQLQPHPSEIRVGMYCPTLHIRTYSRVNYYYCTQVKSRRQHREHHRSVLLKAQAAEKEQRLAAERRVKSEQEALRLKQKQEEALVRLEMVKIRRQLKEKQEREKYVSWQMAFNIYYVTVSYCMLYKH